jgi:hypothetical protein
MAVMSFPVTAIGAGATTGNILAGKPFEFVGRAAMRAAIKALAAGVSVQIINGVEIIAQNEYVPLGTSGQVVDPDDFHFEWIGRGRQQIVISSTAATSWWATIKVQAV